MCTSALQRFSTDVATSSTLQELPIHVPSTLRRSRKTAVHQGTGLILEETTQWVPAVGFRRSFSQFKTKKLPRITFLGLRVRQPAMPPGTGSNVATYLAFHFAAEMKRMYQGNKTFARCLRNVVSRTRVLQTCLQEGRLKCEESVAKVTASDGDT